MDYWGAQAVWYSAGPEGYGSWYTMPAYDSGANELTSPPSKDGNTGPTIDTIHAQLHNSQPAHLSALADQWQNMYNLLDALRTQLLTESTTLHDEKWKSGKARDAFMKTGPGQALAYLDAWMDSTISNQVALQGVVSIILEYQGKMDTLWKEYGKAVNDAKNLSFGAKFGDWFWHYNLLGGGDQPDYDRATDQDKIDQINKVKLEYNVKAQQLAWDMAQEMFGAFSTFSGGHGPVYFAPDAVFDPPDMVLPNMPNVGGPPNVSTPPTPPPMPTPPPVPTPPPTSLTHLTNLTPPPIPTTPTLPTQPPTPTAPTVPTPPNAPVAPPVLDTIVTPLPVAVPETLTAPGVPNGVQAPAPETVNAFAPKTPNTNGLISRSTLNASEGSAPPGAMPRGMRGLSRNLADGGEPPPTGRGANRAQANDTAGPEREPGAEDLFGGRGMSAPPVLGNNRRGHSRAGAPPAVTSDEISTGLPGRSDASPPILARAKRPDETKSRSGFGPATATRPTGESEALTPTLRAPSAPISGADVSGLEEVPATLRTPARAADPAPRELVNRRSGRKLRTPATEEQHETTAPPTADEAFSVETPGGGVLGGGQEPEGYVAQAQAQVRAN
jgi:hypothetical protein